jgi:hypothetical protein
MNSRKEKARHRVLVLCKLQAAGMVLCPNFTEFQFSFSAIFGTVERLLNCLFSVLVHEWGTGSEWSCQN